MYTAFCISLFLYITNLGYYDAKFIFNFFFLVLVLPVRDAQERTQTVIATTTYFYVHKCLFIVQISVFPKVLRLLVWPESFLCKQHSSPFICYYHDGVLLLYSWTLLQSSYIPQMGYILESTLMIVIVHFKEGDEENIPVKTNSNQLPCQN